MNEAMKEGTSASAEKKRNRALGAAAAAMFAVAIGVFGGLSYLQGQALKGNTMEAQFAERSKRTITTPQQQTEMTAKAEVLRDKWRPWAMEHKVELQRMLSAQPGDKAAMLTVWDKLPAVPSEVGLSSELMVPNDNPNSTSAFGWAPIDKVSTPAKDMKPEVRQTVLMGVSKLADKREDDFATQRDIVIATSLSGTRTHINLWASGRITEQTLEPPEARPALLQKLKAEGRMARESDHYGPHQEVQPPYDFLS